MADTILVITEQREGKLNRVSFETITGAQAIAADTGWTLEAAVAGSGVSDIAAELAKTKVSKVYDIESPGWNRTRLTVLWPLSSSSWSRNSRSWC